MGRRGPARGPAGRAGRAVVCCIAVPVAAAAAALRGTSDAAERAKAPRGSCVVPSVLGAEVSGTGCKPGGLVPPGGRCSWAQTRGYNCSGVGSVRCARDKSASWSADTTCFPNTCSGGPDQDGDPNADYAQCMRFGFTGQRCNPTCLPGSHKRPPGYFTLLCDADGTFDPRGMHGTYQNGITCAPDSCEAGPYNHDSRANYSDCNRKHTGDSCVPDCGAGWGATGPLQLHCTEARGYNASGVTCRPNSCAAGARNPGVGSYAACQGRSTGAMCMPSCPAGYTAQSFELSCDAQHRFDPPHNACSPNSCGSGPEGSPAGDWGACTAAHTGDKCAPKCAEGYAPSGEAFELLCSGKGTYDTGGLHCAAQSCSGGPLPHTAQQGAEYGPCLGETTGSSCRPDCPAGYAPSGTIHLVCTADGFDASGVTCEPASCSGGPNNTRAGEGGSHTWDDCRALHTGDTCQAACGAGWESTGGSFELHCLDGSFAVPPGVGCVRSCSGGPQQGTGDPRADYGSCSSQSAGAVCKPDCGDFYHRSGDFVLHCGADNTYDASSVTCRPNNCAGGPRHGSRRGGVAAEWADCNNLHTGDRCSPACAAGYSQGSAVELRCGSDGRYDTGGEVICAPRACGGGPLQGTVWDGADTAACRSKVTGENCAVVCPAGEHATGELELTCDEDGRFNASAVSCIVNHCRPPEDAFPGYIFADPRCTTVAACTGSAPIKCAEGQVEADEKEGGIKLDCPADGGQFVPDGCSQRHTSIWSSRLLWPFLLCALLLCCCIGALAWQVHARQQAEKAAAAQPRALPSTSYGAVDHSPDRLRSHSPSGMPHSPLCKCPDCMQGAELWTA
eukprot:TRINITY_DN30279_c0_g1_i1.p1 TRINITY_DN30279_c0_g1~~TRINITY_DN30279_c0_g1_i1.p1  ORF type:complete len:865 (+),score=206.98 TRINITY_DN30279_c0_g1_i1:67-2595(+)